MQAICLFTIVISLSCYVRPMQMMSAGPASTSGNREIDHYIAGGVDVQRGAWPWQLSLQSFNGTFWSHKCGATLLSPTKALTSGSCVDGRLPSTLRVIAGLHQQSDLDGTQTVNVDRIVLHERYAMDNSETTYSNDIAIVHLASPVTINDNVQIAYLPPNNNDDFVKENCIMTGWGHMTSNSPPSDVLQQASVEVISTHQCINLAFALVWDNQICTYDNSTTRGLCFGDVGGPLNCPDNFGGYFVAGVASWFTASVITDDCQPRYPSVFTRTSAYLYWIYSH